MFLDVQMEEMEAMGNLASILILLLHMREINIKGAFYVTKE